MADSSVSPFGHSPRPVWVHSSKKCDRGKLKAMYSTFNYMAFDRFI